MTDGAGVDGFEVLADRVHRYNYPIESLFSALTDGRARWLRLAPGEVAPRVVEAVAPARVVWSSLWPASPEDRIELELSLAGPEYVLYSRTDHDAGRQSLLRMRWLTASPPDARGVGITRQRLNQKFGADLRAVVSEYYWGRLTGS